MYIKKILENSFSKEKLCTDFYNLFFKEYKNTFLVEIEDEISDKTKKLLLNSEEQLTAFEYFVDYQKGLGVWYKVDIAIGKFRNVDEEGIMAIEKGIVRLYFNSDLSCYDGEIYYNSMYEKRFYALQESEIVK